MNERYSKIGEIQIVNSGSGCPAMFEAGALLKDNNLNKVVVQLKFRNAGDKKIKSLGLSIKLFDEEHLSICNDIFYQYTELDVQANDSFAADTPVVLPVENGCNLDIQITEVVLSDSTVWYSNTDENKNADGNSNALDTGNVKKSRKIYKVLGFGIVGAVILSLVLFFAYNSIFKLTAFEYLKKLCINDGQNNLFLISEYNNEEGKFFIDYTVLYDEDSNSIHLSALMNDYGIETTDNILIDIPNSLSGKYNVYVTYNAKQSNTYYEAIYKINAAEFTMETDLQPYSTSGDWRYIHDGYSEAIGSIIYNLYNEVLRDKGYTYADLGFDSL